MDDYQSGAYELPALGMRMRARRFEHGTGLYLQEFRGNEPAGLFYRRGSREWEMASQPDPSAKWLPIGPIHLVQAA